jgi:hypothetical protein
MRARLLVTPLLLVLIAACGGGSSAGTGGSSTGRQGSTASPTAEATGGTGTVDCAKIKSAGAQLLAVQLLAQLKTPETIASIKSKEFGNLDLDAFLAAMHDLHALDGVSSPLGDPKASIDFYEKAANAAKVLFATEPMTQAAIDTYNENVGSLVDFLGHQAPISAAMDAVGC